MTTIAYDGRYIAADGLRGCSRMIAEIDCNKFREFNGWVAALCGDYCALDVFCSEFCNFEKSTLPEQYSPSGIGFHKDYGVCRIGITRDRLYFYERSPAVEADGSGMDFAIAAMDFGRGAVDAVKYASTRCKGTGGVILCFDTKLKKYIKVK